MKKTFVICLLFCCCWANVTAQTVTINCLPKNLKGVRMNFQMDFSQAVIFGLSEKDFAEYEKDWYNDKQSIVSKFRTGANISLGKSYGIGNYKDALYTVKVIVNTITDEGFIICDVDIVDKHNQVLFHIDHLTGGKEPSFSVGTKLARIKIWATLTGKKLGSILKKELKKD